MSISIYDKKDFADLLTHNSNDLIKRCFHKIYSNLNFENRFVLTNKICIDIDYFKKCTKYIIQFMEIRFQDINTKILFKKFIDKINCNNTFKFETLELINELLCELEKYHADISNITITDEMLQEMIWSIEETKYPDADAKNISNDLTINHIENTPRYKYMTKMHEEEQEYFAEHGISIANILEYRKILIARGKREINRIAIQYEEYITQMDSILDNSKDKLLNQQFALLLDKLPRVNFDTLEIISGNSGNSDPDNFGIEYNKSAYNELLRNYSQFTLDDLMNFNDL